MTVPMKICVSQVVCMLIHLGMYTFAKASRWATSFKHRSARFVITMSLNYIPLQALYCKAVQQNWSVATNWSVKIVMPMLVICAVNRAVYCVIDFLIYSRQTRCTAYKKTSVRYPSSPLKKPKYVKRKAR